MAPLSPLKGPTTDEIQNDVTPSTNLRSHQESRRRRAGSAVAASALLGAVRAGAVVHAASADMTNGAEHISLFEHDTSQQFLALAPSGSEIGDVFVFGGGVLDHEGGTELGRMAGSRTTTSPAEIVCSAAFTIHGIVDQGAFSSGPSVDFAVVGGTGAYRHARGTITAQLLVNSPHHSDALFAVDLS